MDVSLKVKVEGNLKSDGSGKGSWKGAGAAAGLELEGSWSEIWASIWSWSWGGEGEAANPSFYSLRPPESLFGPKWPFEARAKSRMAPGAVILYRFKNQKMSYPLPAAGHTITILVRGFSLKVHFQRNLWSESTCRPPQFHRFRSY